jgi:pyrroline-5-carboxylate reductase
MADSLPSLGFLGAGSMGGAILRGVVASGIPVDGGIIATNRTTQKAASLSGLAGVTAVALDAQPTGNIDAVAAARIVLVGVKPAMVPELLREISPALRDDAIVVSLAAGLTTETFAEHLPAGVSVVRTMPNTPATVGKAVTGLAAGAAASAEDVAIVRRLFELVGVVVEVPEEQIDALGTISGSGPAYVYLLIEELTKAAVAKGFDEADARLMVEQTFIGTTALLAASDEAPAELRRQVTSPHGTTERAIGVLQNAHLDDLFTQATDAALARSKELAAGA